MSKAVDRPPGLLLAAGLVELVNQPGTRHLGAFRCFRGIARCRMLRAVVSDTGGTELTFADGKFVVDDAYVAPIREATKGHPERYPYQEALKMMNGVFSRNLLKGVQSRVQSSHLRIHGLR